MGSIVKDDADSPNSTATSTTQQFAVTLMLEDPDAVLDQAVHQLTDLHNKLKSDSEVDKYPASPAFVPHITIAGPVDVTEETGGLRTLM